MPVALEWRQILEAHWSANPTENVILLSGELMLFKKLRFNTLKQIVLHNYKNHLAYPLKHKTLNPSSDGMNLKWDRFEKHHMEATELWAEELFTCQKAI